MDVTQIRRCVAGGTDPAQAYLQLAPATQTTTQLAAGVRALRASLEGVDGPLLELLQTPGVTDVLVNSESEAWIDAGRGLEPVAGFYLEGGAAQVRNSAVRMAAAAGQRLDDATPIVDATLPSGVRLHAVLPPLSGICTVISLRIPAPSTLSLEELVQGEMMHPWMGHVLHCLVQARVSGIISGATGTGKTTLLAALLGLVDPAERLICIEEVSELRPQHPHVVHLQARAANVQNAGAVSMSDLVKAAMRMRPDRLILGEARGTEVREMLSALNTGHQGGWATVHANSAVEIPARLEALGALAGMSRATVCAQALPAFDVLVQLRREVKTRADGSTRVTRRVTQLARLSRRENGDLGAVPLLDVLADNRMVLHPPWGDFASSFDLPEAPTDLLVRGEGVECEAPQMAELPEKEDFPPPPPPTHPGGVSGGADLEQGATAVQRVTPAETAGQNASDALVLPQLEMSRRLSRGVR